MAAAGYPAEAVARARQAFARDDGAIRVLPEVLDALALFFAVATQWTYAGQAAMPMGLDYARVEAVLRLRATPRRDWPGLFAALQVMEAAALPVLQRQLAAAIEGARKGRR
ncbi:MAG: hypothetical protein OHK0024_36860 [Thalassobaculales bacterium]